MPPPPKLFPSQSPEAQDYGSLHDRRHWLVQVKVSRCGGHAQLPKGALTVIIRVLPRRQERQRQEKLGQQKQRSA